MQPDGAKLYAFSEYRRAVALIKHNESMKRSHLVKALEHRRDRYETEYPDFKDALKRLTENANS